MRIDNYVVFDLLVCKNPPPPLPPVAGIENTKKGKTNLGKK
jgi:hypothetical protein